ncbi:hypothetical protein VHEMI05987 [[Torrubiella] hemipterigena]|nr:hypothetical protein VHEMI05987 [[Torrubiella] hemipterigena]
MSSNQPHTPTPSGPTLPPGLCGSRFDEQQHTLEYSGPNPAMTDQDTIGCDSPPPSASRLSPHTLLNLFICRICTKPYRDATTLPCGRTMCKACVPTTYDRIDISYPADPERQKGFICPIKDCAKEHTIGDCATDVVLNKLAEHLRDALRASDADGVADSSSLLKEFTTIWNNAELNGTSDDDKEGAETAVEQISREADEFDNIQTMSRSEMDCQICYALFHDPITTGCGHTFCRSCLYRILDHSRYCPICRRKLAISPRLTLESCPANEALSNIITTCWQAESIARADMLAADEAARRNDLGVPLFICTLAFPQMPTFLHIFEPRYKLMIRRALDNDRTFGMVQPKRPRHSGDANFYELGTLMRIVNAEFYPDGRCLIETIGLSRFRVVRHGSVDGYAVAETERIHDISLEEEEALEALQVSGIRTQGVTLLEIPIDQLNNEATGQPRVPNPNPPLAARVPPAILQDLDTLPTQDLVRFALEFVDRMRERSAPWLADNVLDIYGECPRDPAVFPWWLASILPIKAREKYRLLSTSSVRSRLKICCSWILEWEGRIW